MPQLFGGLLVAILLGFYVWMISLAVTSAVDNTPKEFTENMTNLFNITGGLISATVTAILGATRTGELPAQRTFEKNLTGVTQRIAGYIPSVYILVWVICGVITVIYGYILYENVSALTVQAKSWLITAIGAGYAYFGINPNGSSAPTPQPTPQPAPATH